MKVKVDSFTNKWRIDVTNAEIQDINLPSDMQRAFSVQAEAEQEARAIQIKAHAELKASEVLRRAAETLDKSPNSIQLRI